MTTCTGSQRTNHPKDRPAPDTRVLQLPQSPPAAPDLEPVQDPYEQAALMWCQEMGYEGDRLPVGWRYGPGCVLEKATGFLVDGYKAFDQSSARSYRLPPAVRSFVQRFDGMEYPHLDLDRQGE